MCLMMEKKSKASSVIPILMILLTVIQAVILVIGISFVNKVNEAEVLYLKQQAREKVEWTIDQSKFRKKEVTLNKQFISNDQHNIYSFYHSQDQDLHLTLESSSLNMLFKKNYLRMTESEVDGHLILTLYFNPLHEEQAQTKDLLPAYQVVKYQKPEIVKLYEAERKREEEVEESEESELIETESVEEETLEEEQSMTPEHERLQACLNLPSFEPLYPFESESILLETDDYIVYGVSLLESDALNAEFYQRHFGPTGVYGGYGWENGLFSVVQPSESE